MLKQTINDSKTKAKSFSVYKQPANKIKEWVSKLRNSSQNLAKKFLIGWFSNKGFMSEDEFNKFYKNKLKQFKYIWHYIFIYK
jgi:hypothetical protein